MYYWQEHETIRYHYNDVTRESRSPRSPITWLILKHFQAGSKMIRCITNTLVNVCLNDTNVAMVTQHWLDPTNLSNTVIIDQSRQWYWYKLSCVLQVIERGHAPFRLIWKIDISIWLQIHWHYVCIWLNKWILFPLYAKKSSNIFAFMD